MTTTSTENFVNKDEVQWKALESRVRYDRSKVEARKKLSPPKGSPEACVGVNGVWWDVSDLVRTHPGGRVIESYFGKDATVMFNMFHPHTQQTLDENAHLIKRIGEYDPLLSQCDKDLIQLKNKLKAEGVFNAPPMSWLVTQFAWAFLHMAMLVFFVTRFGHYSFFDRDRHNVTHMRGAPLWMIKYLGVPAIVLYWNTLSYLGHDS